MFKTNFFRFLMLALSVSILVSSCDEEKTPDKPSNIKTIKDKDVRDYGKWYYFSFATGDFVGEGIAVKDTISPISDSAWAERTDWDIAFHRNNVRTNSGLSGKGQGGVLPLTIKDMDDVKEVPAGDFVVDAETHRFIAVEGMPPLFSTSSVCKKMNKWADFDHDTMAWYIDKERKGVFIVRTADGKYVKFQFVNFLNDKDESGYLSFKYIYQANGSKNSTKF